MMGYFPETFNKEERCLLPALSLPFCSLSNCELSNPTSLIIFSASVVTMVNDYSGNTVTPYAIREVQARWDFLDKMQNFWRHSEIPPVQVIQKKPAHYVFL